MSLDSDPLLRARISKAKREIAVVPGLTDSQIKLLAEGRAIGGLVIENKGDVGSELIRRHTDLSVSDEYDEAYRTYLYNLGVS